MNCPHLRIRYWLILIPAMVCPMLGYLAYFATDLDQRITQALYLGSKGMLVGLPLAGVLVLDWPFTPREWVPVLPRPRYAWSIGLGLVLGFWIFGSMALLMATPLADFVLDGSPVVMEKMAKIGVMENFFLFACAISILHSALEEYYWRWFVFKRLRWHFKGLTPHIIAGVAFSLHHYVLTWIYFNPWLALFLGFMTGIGGFLWSLLYERTGTLVGPWISHVIVDFAIFWVAFRMVA